MNEIILNIDDNLMSMVQHAQQRHNDQTLEKTFGRAITLLSYIGKLTTKHSKLKIIHPRDGIGAISFPEDYSISIAFGKDVE